MGWKIVSRHSFALNHSGLFDRAQGDVFRGHNQPKSSKHDFAFGGLLRCAHDDCTATAEIKKQRYVYYRCTGYRGKCSLPYFREEELGERLVQVLKGNHIPDDVLAQLEKSLLHDQGRAEAHAKPFDVIFKRMQSKEWLPQGDDFRTFLGKFVSDLPQRLGV